MPRRRAREQQVRHVRTGDQQDDRHDNQENGAGEQNRRGTADAREHDVADGSDRRRVSLVARRVFARQPRRDHRQVGLRLRERDARLESSRAKEHRLTAIAQRVKHLVGKQLFHHRGRYPHVRTHDPVHADEARRRDADHQDDDVVETQFRADDVGPSAEARLPRAVVHDGDRMRACRVFFFRQEVAPGRRSQTQGREVVHGHQLREHPFRRAVRLPRHDAWRCVAGQRTEDLVLRLIVFQVDV